MAFQVPPFLVAPVATITDEEDPERAEIIAFRISVDTCLTNVITAMAFLSPNWGGAPVLPAEPAHNAGTNTRTARLTELRQVINIIMLSYAAAYGAFATGNAPQTSPPAPAPPVPRPPKTSQPEKFLGKPSADAHMRQ
jgi:hypothetical protein